MGSCTSHYPLVSRMSFDKKHKVYPKTPINGGQLQKKRSSYKLATTPIPLSVGNVHPQSTTKDTCNSDAVIRYLSDINGIHSFDSSGPILVFMASMAKK